MLIIGVNKKYLRNILTVLALLLTAFALPSVTQAEVEFYRYSAKGRAAEADFSSVDKSGCVYTYVNVEAVDGSIKTKGKPEAAYVASVYISQNDWCTETYLEAYTNGYVELAEGDFQIDDKLNSATLNTAIELYDNYSGNSLPLDISINWTGSGDLYKSGPLLENDLSHSPGSIYHHSSFNKGSYREAEALGTISDGTTNFTPTPSYDARMVLATDRFSSKEIIHVK